MMRVIFSKKSEKDLGDISDYIASRNQERAVSFVKELTNAAFNRGIFPNSGRHRSDVREGLYTFPYGRYIIIYSILADHVYINRIVHSARDIDHIVENYGEIND